MDPRTATILILVAACTGDDAYRPLEAACAYEGEAPDFTTTLGCESDFLGLASEPLDAAIPGARSLKFVLDRADGSSLYFQNSRKYQVHWDFASEHLSGRGLPLVPELGSFNEIEYYSPDRRFVLDAIHRHFRESYGPPPDRPNAWYAMDVELKLDVGPDGEPGIVIKQARPHPGRGQ